MSEPNSLGTMDGDAKMGRTRFLVRATISVATGNEQKTNPALAGRLQRAMQWVDADDYYFVIEHGKRCIYFFLTVAGTHELPRIAEALWIGLDAEVEFLPANRAAVCRFMKMITLPKLRDALRDLSPVVKVPDSIAERARIPIERMVAIS